ncbi:MAG: hypothetical protein ACTHPD_07250 [Rhizomicrobium sp.]
MFGRLFPKSFDNAYRGHWLAVWILGAVSVLKIMQGTMSMIMARHTMITADGIPVDTYPPEAAEKAIAMFALLGLNLLVLPVQSFVAIVRYRSMIPFLYLMMIVVQIGYRVLNALNGAANYQASGFFVNMGILALMVLGFVLSLRTKSAT